MRLSQLHVRSRAQRGGVRPHHDLIPCKDLLGRLPLRCDIQADTLPAVVDAASICVGRLILLIRFLEVQPVVVKLLGGGSARPRYSLAVTLCT